MLDLRVSSRVLLLAVVAVCIIGCKPQKPKGILSARKMEAVLFDYHLAQSMSDIGALDEGASDEQRYELQEAVFRKHGIDRALFDSSMHYYCSDLTKLNAIYRRLSKRMERQAMIYGSAVQSNDVYSSLGTEGDTANVWGGRPIMVVSSRAQENLLTWQQACDTTWKPGDDVMWRFRHKLLIKDSAPQVLADFIVTYTNDSIHGIHTRLTGRESVDILVENPNNWTPKLIIGHVFIPENVEEGQAALCIMMEHKLIRFHKIQEEAENKGLSADSLQTDSLRTDSLNSASGSQDNARGQRRLSPSEFRDRQPVDQKIDVVKELPYQPSARPTRQHLQQPRRQKKK